MRQGARKTKDELSIWGLKVELCGEDLYKVEYLCYSGNHKKNGITINHIQKFKTSKQLITFCGRYKLDYKKLLTEGIKNTLL